MKYLIEMLYIITCVKSTIVTQLTSHIGEATEQQGKEEIENDKISY